MNVHGHGKGEGEYDVCVFLCLCIWRRGNLILVSFGLPLLFRSSVLFRVCVCVFHMYIGKFRYMYVYVLYITYFSNLDEVIVFY